MLTPLEEPLKEADRAYLACILDQRASIFLKRRKTGWALRIRISDLEGYQQVWISGLFPNIRTPKICPKYVGGRIITFEDRKALRLLSTCFYFLKALREKARIALEFAQTRRGPGRGKKISEEDLQKQAKIAEKLSELNSGKVSRCPPAEGKPECREGVSK